MHAFLFFTFIRKTASVASNSPRNFVLSQETRKPAVTVGAKGARCSQWWKSNAQPNMNQTAVCITSSRQSTTCMPAARCEYTAIHSAVRVQNTAFFFSLFTYQYCAKCRLCTTGTIKRKLHCVETRSQCTQQHCNIRQFASAFHSAPNRNVNSLALR